MATHDYVIDNSTGANVRADINNVLQAILTNNSSSSAPSTTAAYMFWADTTSGTLKIRNSSDNAWVELLQLDGTLTMEDGSASTPGLAFRDDLDTGIFSSAANNINFATGGVERLELSGSSTIFNESGADVNFRVEGDTNVNLLFIDAGEDRIGINESTPLAKFHIKSTDASVSAVNASVNELILENNGSCGMSIFSSTTNQGAIAFGDSDDNDVGKIVYDHSDNSISFRTAANERFRVDSSGRFLLNMSSSVTGARFQVNNQFNTFFAAINDATGCVLQLEKTRSTSPGSYTIVQDGDTLGELQFKGSNGSASVVGANIQAIVNGTPGSGNDLPTDLIFRTMPDGSGSTIKRMRIQEDGRVVIGSGTPDYQTGNMTSGAVGINVTGTSPQVLLHNTNDDKDAYLGMSGANLFLFSADSIPIAFGNGDTERMRLDTSGRLLVGTTATNQNISKIVVKASSPSDTFDNHIYLEGSETSGAARTGGVLGFGGHDGGSSQRNWANIVGLKENSTTNNTAAFIGFETRPAGGSPTEAARIASDGTVQIAASGAIAGFASSHVTGSGAPLKVYKSNSSNHAVLQLIWDHFNTTAGIKQKIQFTIGDDASSDGFNNAGFIAIEKANSWQSSTGRDSAMVFATTNDATESEAMRIRSDGNVGIGDSNPTDLLVVNGGAITQKNTSTSITSSQLFFDNSTTGGQYRVRFDSGSSTVGSISVGTSSTAYNTSSDYRLKENIISISDGITRLKTLIPRRFNWKSDSSKTVDGFIAHEVTAVPEAVTGTKDEVATEDSKEAKKGDPIYQQIDQAKLVPLLTAALQEAVAKLEVLETKVAALEAA